MEIYPFDTSLIDEDPFNIYDNVELPPPFYKTDGDYCIYVRNKKTGMLETICESDLPF